MKIAICDDDDVRLEDVRSRLAELLGEKHQVAEHADTTDALKNLLSIRKSAVDGKLKGEFATTFDDLDVLVVDYDLVHFDDDGGRTSGEAVARMVKAYSTCKYVIVLNQFSRTDFDLSLLGHPNSLADLNLNDGIIDEPALWFGKGADFRPSYWPRIPEILDGWVEFKRGLPDDLSWSIFDALELSPADMGDLSDLAFSHLSQTASTLDELAKVTAADLLIKLIGSEANEILKAGRADILTHFAVSRVAKWLDRCVVRPLDPLIDALHLAERRPYLLNPSTDDLGSEAFWTSLDTNLADRLAERTPAAAYCRKAELLLGKPVAVTARLDDDETVQQLSDEFAYHELADFVLAEDLSKFIPRDLAIEFRAGFGNFNDRRFVKHVRGYEYGPQRRFAFGDV